MHEIKFPEEIHISPVFNISDLIKYHEGKNNERIIEAQWKILTPTSKKEEIEEILDSRVEKSTRNTQYVEYLVKWRGRPIEYSSWLFEAKVNHLSFPLTPKK